VVDLYKEAKRILGATETYRLLQVAERAKNPDVVKLREAISKAEEFGVEESAIAACRNRLQQFEVGDALSKGITKKDTAQLLEAIRKAREIDFADKAKINKAEKTLLLAQAREALQAAAESFCETNAEMLLLAIGDAKAAGVEKKDIGLAELKLKGGSQAPSRQVSCASRGRRASC